MSDRQFLKKPNQETKIMQEFIKKYPHIIIGRDKKDGYLKAVFKSKSGKIACVGTKQKTLQEFG